MTVATLELGQFPLAAKAQQTKAHCLQADEREAAALHPATQENVAPRRRFIHVEEERLPLRRATASCARQRQEYIKLAARRLQNRDSQAVAKTRPLKNTIFGKERLSKRSYKWGRRAVSFWRPFKSKPSQTRLATLPVAHTLGESASCAFNTPRAGHVLQLASHLHSVLSDSLDKH